MNPPDDDRAEPDYVSPLFAEPVVAPEGGIPIEAIADPRLLALVNARFRPEIAREHLLVAYLKEPPYHLDPAAWGAGYLEVTEGGPPPDLREAMREMTPQAHLRDLFRPEYSQAPVSLELTDIPLDPGGRIAYEEVRAALKREPVPVLTRSIELLAEARAAWRAFLDEPWQPHLSDEAPRREVFVAIEPSITG